MSDSLNRFCELAITPYVGKSSVQAVCSKCSGEFIYSVLQLDDSWLTVGFPLNDPHSVHNWAFADSDTIEEAMAWYMKWLSL